MPRNLFTQPLFSPKLINSRFPVHKLPEAHAQSIVEWLASLKSGLNKEKEESIRPAFLQRFFVDLLGYQLMGGLVWTLHHEKGAASGRADAALGTFTNEQRQVVAPFELKGPKTGNLDALMPGRHKSPVQQAWEYAMDLPGSQFVLVSNCIEVRLYALGYGRAAFESWLVADLLQPEHYASFCGLLKADHLISGATASLLKDNAAQERDITQALYADYKNLRQELILGLHHQNPSVAFASLVRHAQKLIDRLLFIAFAESRHLLPAGAIAQAASHIDPYNPQPRWLNFVALFRAVDKGSPYLKIPPYNGGLFAPDAALEQLKASDALVQSFLKLAGYDYAQEVSVTVLGRIFEQSISDLEHIASLGNISAFALTAQASTAPAAVGRKSVEGRRKRDGVVYTPDRAMRGNDNVSQQSCAAEWQLEGIEAAALRAKLTQGHATLRQAVGSPYRGVLTGLNEAFVIDRATRDRLVFADIASTALFKPFLKGDDIERWRLESQDLWLILLPKGWTREIMTTESAASESVAADADAAWAWLQKRHPSLAGWLAPFAAAARKRSDQGDYWWELRACGYYDKFAQPKIFYPDICISPSFCLDLNGMYAGNTGYFLPTGHAWLVALMNSTALWFLIAGMSTHIRGGYRRMFTQHIETLPIPAATPAQQAELATLADAAAQTAQQRLTAQRDFARRITDLLPSPPPKGAQISLSDKLRQWWLLPDFKAFQAEVAKRFKADIALRQRNDWQALFEQEKTRIGQLTANLAAAERRIDAIVYALFGLNAAEITLIEHAVKWQ